MRNTALFALALLLTACGGGDDSNPAPQNVPFTSVSRPLTSAFFTPTGVVARNDSAFFTLWTRIFRTPLPPIPAVNFNTQQVVGIFLGNSRNSCYDVLVTSVYKTVDRLVVNYKETAPAPGTACTLQTGAPGHLVSVPQTDLQVEFKTE